MTGARIGFALIAGALVVGLALLYTAPTPPGPGARPASGAAGTPAASSAPRIDVQVVRVPGPPMEDVAGAPSAADRVAIEGWKALKEGRDAEALQRLRNAVALGAQGVAFGMALAHQRLGQGDEALPFARQAVKERPDSPDAWRLLGQILLDGDDLTGAVDAWEKAQALEPEPALEERLRTLRADAEAREKYLVGATRHFRVRFEGPAESRLAQRILDLLEQAYASVGLALGYYPDTVIDAVLYTQQAFFDVTRSPGWAGGIFDGTVRLPVAGAEPPPEELRRVVTHEYTHAAMAHLLGPDQMSKVPVWMHEGVAMNLEGGDKSRWVADVRHAHRAPIPLARLSGSFLGMSRREADAAYVESYLTVRSLLDRFGQFRLADLLDTCRTESFDRAFADVYRESPQTSLDRALADAGGAG